MVGSKPCLGVYHAQEYTVLRSVQCLGVFNARNHRRLGRIPCLGAYSMYIKRRGKARRQNNIPYWKAYSDEIKQCQRTYFALESTVGESAHGKVIEI
jgi:hypothetical protein